MTPTGDPHDPSVHLRVTCKLVFRLCRRHAWGSPISEDTLLSLALQRSEYPAGRTVCEKLKHEPYIEYHPGRGYRLKNNPDDQAKIAMFLRDSCEHTELQIEATLSRFAQAGAFGAYNT